ncbi:MAG TPA: alpha/beta hydrolase-fold protein [Streptosporangiaceae bacterium]|nr:alpha/beta hydrolase-fold protein [Streptosporangiaceae bacterium]
MVTGELIPRCQRLGLGVGAGRAPLRIAAMGISMGGYGALLLAEKYPCLFAAVAARRGRPVWVASGYADPFLPGVKALARKLPAGAVVTFGPGGGHDGSFFAAQQPPSLALLAGRLY